MLGKPNAPDSTPEMVWRWTSWEDEAGLVHAIPPHAKVISRGAATKIRRYALVCHSDAPLALPRRGTSFNPARCRTLSGKRRDPQVTALPRVVPTAAGTAVTKFVSRRG